MIAIMTLRSLLTQHGSDIALVIGNGINRYNSAPATNSWDDLLVTLAKKFCDPKSRNMITKLPLTEFYDLLELESDPRKSGISLQKEFCDLMKEWRPQEHHIQIVSWAQQARCPLLTTNFDKVLAEAGDCKLLPTRRDGFTDYYPWETYYGIEELDDPCAGFGIWHINGMEHYKRSVRIGLTHYMGSVQRARSWFYRGKERSLFSGPNVRNWRGVGTWLHIVFNKPLLFIGLGLEENEVFLRWLLIERARYFRKFPNRKKGAWYVHTDETDGSGKLFFLDCVGVKPIRVRSYDDIYGSATWT